MSALWLAPGAPTWDVGVLAKRLPEVLERIRQWIGEAEGDDFALHLRAVDAQISVSGNKVEIRGAVPLSEPEDQPDLVTTEQHRHDYTLARKARRAIQSCAAGLIDRRLVPRLEA